MPEDNFLRALYNAYSSGDLQRLLTGSTREDLMAQVMAGQGPLPFAGMNEIDKPVHALASQLSAGRIGVPATRSLGYLHEMLSGLANLAGGQPFVAPDVGFDPRDLAANEAGFTAAAAQRQLPSQQAWDYLSQLLGALRPPERGFSSFIRG